MQLNLLDCPGNVDLGPNEDFLEVLGRAYPRAAPGRLTSLASDPDTDQLDVVARAGGGDVGRELVVWVPDDQPLDLRTENLTGLTTTTVDGGTIVTATVATEGCYALHDRTTTLSCAVPAPVDPVATAPLVPSSAVTPSFTG
ncbi:MAG: hypothetical protein R2726_12730 [Acidimicrobiales bacterium]